MSSAQIENATYANIANGTVGIWPYEFAAQAMFYLNEYKLGNISNLNVAYSTSVLANALESADKELENAFVVSSSAMVTPALMQQINQINANIQQLFALLLLVLILLFAVLVILLVMLVGKKQQPAISKQAQLKQKRRSRGTS